MKKWLNTEVADGDREMYKWKHGYRVVIVSEFLQGVFQTVSIFWMGSS